MGSKRGASRASRQALNHLKRLSVVGFETLLRMSLMLSIDDTLIILTAYAGCRLLSSTSTVDLSGWHAIAIPGSFHCRSCKRPLLNRRFQLALDIRL